MIFSSICNKICQLRTVQEGRFRPFGGLSGPPVASLPPSFPLFLDLSLPSPPPLSLCCPISEKGGALQASVDHCWPPVAFHSPSLPPSLFLFLFFLLPSSIFTGVPNQMPNCTGRLLVRFRMVWLTLLCKK